MDYKFKELTKLGASGVQHLNGSLIDHLIGTKELLAAWSASTELQDAGLYHAVYGTSGLNNELVSVKQRSTIADIIGAKAEEIVYQYCACDREFFWPKFELENNPDFRNRFSAEIYKLKPEILKNFCELTVANELEIASKRPGFITSGGVLHRLFLAMYPQLSSAARRSVDNAIKNIS